MKQNRKKYSKSFSSARTLNKVLFMMLFMLFQHFSNHLKAQEYLNYSIYLPELNNIVLPVTQSNNPSTLMLLPKIEYGNLDLLYGHESGNFKPVMQEGVSNSFLLSTEKYYFFKNTTVYGSFSGGQKWDAFTNYSNVENPYRGTPYIMLDTVGFDDTNREQYKLEGKVAHNFGRSVLGASVQYRVGVSAQSRDPRAKILINHLVFNPGYMFQFSNLNLGINLGIDFRNEEIAVKTIEKNRQDNIYYLFGLRSATTTRDNSFLRQYKRLAYQADAQLSNRWLTVLLGGEISNEDVNDGEHNWAVNRYFARLNESSGYLKTYLTFTHSLQVQSLNFKARLENSLGTEIIQTKELIPPYNQENWVTIAENQSYHQNRIVASLGYSFTKLRYAHERNYTIGVDAEYVSYSSEYRVLNDKMSYQNMFLSTYFYKSFATKNGLFTLKPALEVKLNLKNELAISDGMHSTLPPYYKKIEDIIVRPDFSYITSNYLAPQLRLSYEHVVSEHGNKLYLKLFTRWQILNNSGLQSRKEVLATLGFLL